MTPGVGGPGGGAGGAIVVALVLACFTLAATAPAGGGVGAPIRCYFYALDCKGRSDQGKNLRCDGDDGARECPRDPSHNNYDYSHTFCKILWRNYTVVLKGCHTQYTADCYQSGCVGANATDRDGFCCCNTSLCNTEFLLQSSPASHKSPDAPAASGQSVVSSHDRRVAAPWAPVVAPLAVIPLVVSALVLIARWVLRRRAAAKKLRLTAGSAAATQSDARDLRKLVQPVAKLSEGRFGAVWKAVVLHPPDGKVRYAATKVISDQHRRQWEAERDIYACADLRHENVASYVGAADYSRETGVAAGLWIVTAFCDGGSLCDYLGAHTLSAVDACRIAHGTAAGLAFLHEFAAPPPPPSEQSARPPAHGAASPRRSGGKPSVAHRDLKSANVLLTADLTPRIADFGFAVQFDPLATDSDGGGFRFGPKLPLVGTLRYMAPEVLEGAVEYTREALLQCDVYSLGLVLWELLSRTSFDHAPPPDGAAAAESSSGDGASAAAAAPLRPLPSPPPPPPYAPPLERELGQQPTLAAMQEAVVARHVRPLFEQHWLLHRVGSRLCETATECWDAEPAARVSSCCAEQRLRSLLDSGRT